MNTDTEHPEPIVLRRYGKEWRALMLKAELEAAGIPAWVEGGVTAGFRAEAPGEAVVSVRTQDAQRALEIAEAFDDRGHEDHDEDKDQDSTS